MVNNDNSSGFNNSHIDISWVQNFSSSFNFIISIHASNNCKIGSTSVTIAFQLFNVPMYPLHCSEFTDHDFLYSNHGIYDDSYCQWVSASVYTIELRLGDSVIDINNTVNQLVLWCYLFKSLDPCIDSLILYESLWMRHSQLILVLLISYLKAYKQCRYNIILSNNIP
jgi:hypothetical protein